MEDFLGSFDPTLDDDSKFDNTKLVPDENQPLKNLFKEYVSFDNAKKGVAKSFPVDAQNKKWIALEKVHGSNFCFLYNGTELVCCRRTGPLDPFETFYNFQEARDKVKPLPNSSPSTKKKFREYGRK
jgi:hypothetical protein